MYIYPYKVTTPNIRYTKTLNKKENIMFLYLKYRNRFVKHGIIITYMKRGSTSRKGTIGHSIFK